MPFLAAESCFYRQLLHAVGYFAPGPWQGVDPFRPFKLAELDTPEAAAHYRAVLDRYPEDAEAHNNLGTAIASSGDLAGAETHFRLALRLRPGYADAERNLQRLRGSM